MTTALASWWNSQLSIAPSRSLVAKATAWVSQHTTNGTLFQGRPTCTCTCSCRNGAIRKLTCTCSCSKNGKSSKQGVIPWLYWLIIVTFCESYLLAGIELTWWESFTFSTGHFVDLATLLEDIAAVHQLELQVAGHPGMYQQLDQLTCICIQDCSYTCTVIQ